MLLVLAFCTGGTIAGLAGHDRAPSWCIACLLGLWMVVSPPDSALDIMEGERC